MDNSKYRAPALEKGLDILELLSREKRPLLITQMAALLERSVSEIFRMALVLQERGYLEPADDGDALVLSNKLFLLGINTRPAQNIIVKAIPLMQSLCKKTREACHLVIAVEDHIVVIACVETPGDLGYSVRIGHTRPIVDSNSGIILYAFQPPKVREAWHQRLIKTTTTEAWQAFDKNAEIAREQGYILRQSTFVKAVTDISCPVFSSNGVAAALTIPHLETLVSAEIDICTGYLELTAEALSRDLGG